MSELRKRRNTAGSVREPITEPHDQDSNLEDILLHKLDVFLYNVESRLNDLEEYGLQKLGAVDESVSHAYEVLSQLRKESVDAGRKKAEALLNVMERHYESSTTTAAAAASALAGLESPRDRISHALKFMEAKLAHLESTCFEVVDSTGTMAIGVQEALQNAVSRLLTYDELPIQWRDNPHILRGYRFCKGYMECIYSLVKVHNETCNIWTHLLGFFIMLALAFYHWPTTVSWHQSSTMDKVTMGIFLIAAMKCLACSVLWHTFSGISRLNMKQKFACVDYSGITVLIAASILTTEYSALYCRQGPRIFHMTVTSLFGIVGTLFTWLPIFDAKEFRPKRILFFVSFAVAGVLGYVHAALLHGFSTTFNFYLPVFKSLLCYILGVVIYSFQIPERWFPGWVFDYLGMSHNIWHIAVFGGIYYHYLATVRLLENARDFSCGIA